MSLFFSRITDLGMGGAGMSPENLPCLYTKEKLSLWMQGLFPTCLMCHSVLSPFSSRCAHSTFILAIVNSVSLSWDCRWPLFPCLLPLISLQATSGPFLYIQIGFCTSVRR